eukprot:Lithocolla_globosa_v1_NODE_655_length_3500_cov_12.200581.p1 type:complete len:511 gc:universal NODE_655_length_3500_cov_12.200581:2029-497(-)
MVWKPAYLMCVVTLHVFCQGVVQNGVFSAIIDQLQDEFGFTSARAGSLFTISDAMAALVVLPAGYFVPRYHMPRWLGTTMLLMGFSNLILASTNWFYPEGSRDGAYWLFVLAMLVYGPSSVFIWIVGPVYISLNCAKKDLSLFLSIFAACSAFASVVGFVVGGFAADYWSLAIAGFGCLSCIGAVPYFFLPRRLSDDVVDRTALKGDVDHDVNYFNGVTAGKDQTPKEAMKHWWRELVTCLHDSPFCFNVGIVVVKGFMIAGVVVFGPQFFTLSFGLEQSFASIMFGVLAVPGAASGAVMGGWIQQRFSRSTLDGIRQSMVFSFVAACFFWVFLLDNVIAFYIFFIILQFVVFLTDGTLQSILIRTQPADHRGSAVALHNLLARVGSIPGPVVLGTLMDASCTLWNPSATDPSRVCLDEDYDITKLRWMWSSLLITVLFLAVVLFIGLYLSWRTKSKLMSEESQLAGKIFGKTGLAEESTASQQQLELSSIEPSRPGSLTQQEPLETEHT